MRIIAGLFKGRHLAGPEGAGLRPTSDSLRETLFNILGPSVAGMTVLDGFAGTGALGLEALSRGAARVTFVERDRRAIRVLEENITRCGAENTCAIIKRDWASAFAAALPSSFGGQPSPGLPAEARQSRAEAGTPEPVLHNLILLDPPYDVQDLEAVVRQAARLLAPAGRLVLEHSRRRASPEGAPPLQRTRVVTAGDSALSFYE